MIVNNVNSSSNYYSNDAFTPSGTAQSFSNMLNKLKNVSDVREDKVNEIQQKISSGQYFVSAQDIAASLLANRF